MPAPVEVPALTSVPVRANRMKEAQAAGMQALVATADGRMARSTLTRRAARSHSLSRTVRVQAQRMGEPVDQRRRRGRLKQLP